MPDEWETEGFPFNSEAAKTVSYLFLNEELFLRRNGFLAVPHRTSTGTIPRALRDVHGAEQLREEVQCSSDPSISHPTPSWPMSALG